MTLFLGIMLIHAGLIVFILMLAALRRSRGMEGCAGPRVEREAPGALREASGAGFSSAPGACERHAVPGVDLTGNPFLGACGGCLAGYIFDALGDYVPCPDCPPTPPPPLDDDYVRGAFAAIVALNFSHLINGKETKP